MIQKGRYREVHDEKKIKFPEGSFVYGAIFELHGKKGEIYMSEQSDHRVQKRWSQRREFADVVYGGTAEGGGKAGPLLWRIVQERKSNVKDVLGQNTNCNRKVFCVNPIVEHKY